MSVKARSSATGGRAESHPSVTTPSTADSTIELRARLQDALEELEEQRAAADALSTSLAAARERVMALEAAAADRLRGTSDNDNGALYVAELDALRRERAALEERERSDAGQRLTQVEKRLRSAEATLAQTLQALEEHRVTAVELQMIADATEHHAAEVEQGTKGRVQHAETRLAGTRAELERALQLSEERRIAAAEMQTILDATEHRLAQLQQEREGLDQRHAAWGAERAALEQQLAELREQSEHLRAERASTTTALERTLADLALQRDVAAGLGIERDAALEQADEQTQVAAQLEQRIAGLHGRAAELESALEAATAALAQAAAARVDERESAARVHQEQQTLHQGVQQELAAAQGQISSLTAERERAQEAARAQLARLEHDVAERDTALAEARAALDVIQTARDNLAAELTTVGDAVAERDATVQALIAERNERAAAHRTVNDDLAALQATLARERDEWTAARSELMSAQAQLAADRDAQQHAAHEQIGRLEQGVAERDTSLAELRATLDAVQTARDAHAADLTALGNAVAERDNRLQTLATERKELEAAHQTVNRQLETLHAHTQTIERELAEMRAHEAQVQAALQRTTATLEEERRAASAATTEHHAVAQQLREVHETLTRRDHDLEELHAALVREREEWAAARSEFIASLEREGGAQQELVTARQALEERLHHAETERDGERERGARLHEERAQLGTAIALVREELKEHVDAVAALTSERNTLKAAIAQSEAAHQAAEAGRVAALDAGSKAQAQFGELQRRLEADLERLRTAVQERDAAADRTERALGDARRQGTDLERQLSETQQAREAALRAQSQLTESLRDASEHRARLERKVAELEKARDVVVRDHAKATQSLRATEEQRVALETALAELQEQQRAVLQERERLTATLREEREQRNGLEGRVAELEGAHREATQQHAEAHGALQAESSQRREIERQLQSEANEKRQLQAEIGRLGEARTALQQHVQELQAQLSAEQGVTRELRELHAHGNELYQLVETELGETRSAKEEAVIQLASMQVALAERTQELASLQHTLGALQQREREVQSGLEQTRTELQNVVQMRDELRARVEALGDRDKLAERATELEGLLAQSDQQGDVLRRELTETQDQLHAAMQRVAAATTQADDLAALRGTLAEREVESDRLRRHVDNVSEQRDVLQRERDQLKRRVQDADDVDRVRAEHGRLQEQLDEAEHQQAEATQRHSTAVSGYMVELNQRSELLRQRELHIEKLSEEVRLLQHVCEDNMAQLGDVRQERDLLQLRVRELESVASAARPAPAPPKAAAGDGLRLAPADAAAPAPEKSESAAPQTKVAAKTAATPAAAKTPTPAAPTKPALAAPAAPPALPVVSSKGLQPTRNATGALNMVHLEDFAPFRDHLRTAVARFTRVKYSTAQDAPATVAPPTLLAINLLVKSIDPLVTMAHADAWGVNVPQAFAYCADSTRGTVIGLTEFFPHPFDLDACAARINARPGGTQRLLVVGESVELLNDIRSTMNKIRCSTSVALDARQAFDLVGMVKPQLVLVDVGLQRAEGLRLIARLRSDPAYAGIGIGLMWTHELDANEFRTHVTRAVRDYRFSLEELGRTAANLISELGFATEPLRDAG